MKTITSSQLVSYLLSNIDDITEAFNCKESDLKKPLLILNSSNELLETCKGFIEDCDCDAQDIGGDWGSVEWMEWASNSLDKIKAVVEKIETK